ncbi:MAG: amidohydrolase family protein [Candidatus Firestonebacteria bacterium]
MRKFFSKTILLLIFICGILTAQEICDFALLNGRVMDPESNTEEVKNIGIRRGKIVYVGTKGVESKRSLDVSGLVVCPGFIDFLSYDQNGTGEYYKAADGVTTNLSMHGASMANFRKLWVRTRGGLYLNQGGAVSQVRLRYSVGLMGAYDKPTTEQVAKMCRLADAALANGALGLNFSFEYLPGTTAEEAIALAKVVKRYGALCTAHLRYSTMYEKKTNIDAIFEAIDIARKTGVSFQINHINSTGGTFSMNTSLELIKKANDEGLDISMDMYPYNSWGTYLASARFDGNWQKRFNITYKDLQVANTSERLTEEKFKAIREMKRPDNNPLTVAYAIPEKEIITALKFPGMMIGSDTIVEIEKNNHPRGAGCYARLIQKYVNEEKVITLMEAVRMSSYLPAKRLENISSAMKNKGRIKAGADADLLVFDPDKVREKSTVEDPAQYSEGFDLVLVNGEIVKDKDGIRKGIFPGKPVKRDIYPLSEKKSDVTK